MSDLDDYRRFTLTISGFKTTHEARVVAGGFDEFRLYADRAVAELEAALEHALSWEGLLEFIDHTYPPHIFTGESGDPGPRFIVLLRELKQAEATIERLKNTIDLCSGPCSYAERSTP